jgi:MATE family multidrug resistance protein
MWIQLGALLLLNSRDSLFKSIRYWRDWQRPNLPHQLQLLKLGMPIGFTLFVEVSMFSLIALFLAPLGQDSVAGHQIAFASTTLAFMLALSLSITLTIRISYCLGQGRAQQARFIAYTGLSLALILAAGVATLFLCLPQLIASFYTQDSEVLTLAVTLLGLAALLQLPDYLQVTLVGILRGYKDTQTAMYSALLAYWLIGLPLGYGLCYTDWFGAALGAPGFWYGQICGVAIAAAILSLRLRHQLQRRQTSSAMPKAR